MTQAAKAQQPPPATAAQKPSQEPSMEEILASIRRIIADDGVTQSAKPMDARAPAPETRAPAVTSIPARGRPFPPRSAPVDQVVDQVPLPGSAAMARDPHALRDRTVLHHSHDSHNHDSHNHDSHNHDSHHDEPDMASAELPALSAETISEGLLSSRSRAAIDNAFKSLPPMGSVSGQNALTLEDLVKDMLRPMLKSWLDDHLPGIVERIVRAEVERLSRGR